MATRNIRYMRTNHRLRESKTGLRRGPGCLWESLPYRHMRPGVWFLAPAHMKPNTSSVAFCNPQHNKVSKPQQAQQLWEVCNQRLVKPDEICKWAKGPGWSWVAGMSTEIKCSSPDTVQTGRGRGEQMQIHKYMHIHTQMHVYTYKHATHRLRNQGNAKNPKISYL